jgi:pimeloyl-ACP methyl ester carboxylesterase
VDTDLSIDTFEPRYGDREVAGLRERLRAARWPDEETAPGWSQGVPSAYLRELCDYWADGYDWDAAHQRLGSLPQFTTTIDGLRIHFAHVVSPVPGARPLLMTHGWPGSFLEFQEAARMLADPASHGGDPADAFHVVCPSLPGFGFTEHPKEAGWNMPRVARAWDELMQRLGYETYFAQGGDMGCVVSTTMAKLLPEKVRGIHLNFVVMGSDPGFPFDDPTEQELRCIEKAKHLWASEVAYAMLQASKPQTIGYSLADSPVGQCAWIVEKFHGWTDNTGTPESAVARDQLLDNINLYWFQNSGASSARLYWETTNDAVADHSAVELPSAYTVFPEEILMVSERWARLRLPGLRYYGEAAAGGHFAALEVPELFVREVRAGLRATETEPAGDPV